MKKILFFIPVLLFTVSSCRDEIVVKNTPENVFLAFWNTMNDRYVYFEEKKINWDSIYTIYYPKAVASKDENELFSIMSEIVVQFKDSHLSLAKSSTEGAGYLSDSTSYYYRVPIMYYYGFMLYAKYYDQYFETDQYATKNYAYVSYSSFAFKQDISFVISTLDSLNFRDGLILDIRNNDGGYLDNALELASLFYAGEHTVLYKTPKMSPKINDFSNPIPVKYTGRNIVPGTVPIILLTEAKTYSGGNFFAYIMKDLPNCITVGERTGGGGSPVMSEYLPNGWVLNYPYIKNFSSKGVNMENGLEPDVHVNYVLYKDTIIDIQLKKAISILDSINSRRR